ncbi:MAG: tRNA (adenosine(37)-N6)-threonylcarbamoyltransferase complex dimerization subunit type 1 TsaB [Bacilli bacterium]|nr:tRNA (adenosine(37)-N6)-threonylcarbamoyltransferase complex dimerization subunit type 1 TsaB [Bacilli bacterium]
MGYQLILDTSNRLLCVGLASDEKVLTKIQYEAWQRQSEYCLKEVENVLSLNNIKAKDISRIIVTIGPGSYTGVRIALTIAKTLAMVNNIGICAISSLLAIAGNKGKKIALMDARSNRAYIGVYQDGEALVDNKVMYLDDIKQYAYCNQDFEVVGDAMLLGLNNKEIDLIENMFEIAKTQADVNDIYTLVPNYLKD